MPGLLDDNTLIRLPAGGRVSCHHWAFEAVVYNDADASLYLVEGLGVALFKALASSPASLGQLAGLLADHPDAVDSGGLRLNLANLARAYARLSLLEIVEPA